MYLATVANVYMCNSMCNRTYPAESLATRFWHVHPLFRCQINRVVRWYVGRATIDGRRRGMASEKLLCVVAGGSGDLDREVEREL
jgi:hypothetical protein